MNTHASKVKTVFSIGNSAAASSSSSSSSLLRSAEEAAKQQQQAEDPALICPVCLAIPEDQVRKIKNG